MQADFGRILLSEMGESFHHRITRIVPGDADTGEKYKFVDIHVEFDLTAKRDTAISDGWLAGNTLRREQTLTGCSMLIVYQQDSSGQWRSISHELKRRKPTGDSAD